MATSMLKKDLPKVVEIGAGGTADEFYISVANAVASTSTGDLVLIRANWTNNDLYIGIGLFIWGSAMLFMASSTHIYRVDVNISAQTVSRRRRVAVTDF